MRMSPDSAVMSAALPPMLVAMSADACDRATAPMPLKKAEPPDALAWATASRPLAPAPLWLWLASTSTWRPAVTSAAPITVSMSGRTRAVASLPPNDPAPLMLMPSARASASPSDTLRITTSCAARIDPPAPMPALITGSTVATAVLLPPEPSRPMDAASESAVARKSVWLATCRSPPTAPLMAPVTALTVPPMVLLDTALPPAPSRAPFTLSATAVVLAPARVSKRTLPEVLKTTPVPVLLVSVAFTAAFELEPLTEMAEPAAAVVRAVAPPWLAWPPLSASDSVTLPLPPVVVMRAPLPTVVVMVGFRSTSATEPPAPTPPENCTPSAVPVAWVRAAEPTCTAPLTLTTAPAPMPAVTVGVTALVDLEPALATSRPPAADDVVTLESWSASACTCSPAPVTSAALVATVLPAEVPVAAIEPRAPRPRPTLRLVPSATTRLSASARTTATPPPAFSVALPWVSARVLAAALPTAVAPATLTPRPTPELSALASARWPPWLCLAVTDTPCPLSVVVPCTRLVTVGATSAFADIRPTAPISPRVRPLAVAVASACDSAAIWMAPELVTVLAELRLPAPAVTLPLALARASALLTPTPSPPPEALACASARLRARARTSTVLLPPEPPDSSAVVPPLALAVAADEPTSTTRPIDTPLVLASARLAASALTLSAPPAVSTLPAPLRAVVLALALAVLAAPDTPTSDPPDDARAVATVFCPVGLKPSWLWLARIRMLPLLAVATWLPVSALMVGLMVALATEPPMLARPSSAMPDAVAVVSAVERASTVMLRPTVRALAAPPPPRLAVMLGLKVAVAPLACPLTRPPSADACEVASTRWLARVSTMKSCPVLPPTPPSTASILPPTVVVDPAKPRPATAPKPRASPLLSAWLPTWVLKAASRPADRRTPLPPVCVMS